MLGLTTVTHPPFPLRTQFIPKTLTFIPHCDLTLLPLKSRTQRNPGKFFLVYAEGNRNGVEGREKGYSSNGGDVKEEDEKKGEGLPRFNMRWVDLVLDPDPDNVVAVGLTGLLTWASVQVLWQLLLISLAIVLAAVKYSFIAALLIFILITLL